MREKCRARLRVINGTAFQITADRHAHDHRAFRVAVRTPTRHGHLVADLVKGREDVVEELYLDDRFQPADRHSDRAADDVGLGQRRIENACRAEFTLQIGGDLKHAAFAFDLFEILFARAVGDVLAKDDDARVALHLLVHAAVDKIDHRAGVAGKLGTVFGVKQLPVGRIDIGRKDISIARCRLPAAAFRSRCRRPR